MERRSVGLLVVAVVLLAAAVTPSIIGRRVVGQAEMAPIPGPPSAGDCLLEPIAETQQIDRRPTGRLTYRPLAIGRCTSARFGEVVSLIAADQVKDLPPVTPGSTDETAVEDPNFSRCGRDLETYSGSGSAVRTTGAARYWTPAIQIGMVLAGPTPLQMSMGQHWVSCIAFINGEAGHSTSYSRPLRDAFRQDTFPPEASICAATPDLKIVRQVSCTQQHQAEVFAYSFIDGVSPTTLDAACLSFVKQFTGMSDPTAAGRLKVYSARPDTAGEATSVPSPVCLVATVGTRSLTGSLIGLGDNPVPLSS